MRRLRGRSVEARRRPAPTLRSIPASPIEIVRRSIGRSSGQLRSLPILALAVHSACDCRCVMCDIWRANAVRREIAPADLDRHLDAIRRLRVRRVKLTGGEPLLQAKLWGPCERLKALRTRGTLLTPGVKLVRHAAPIEYMERANVTVVVKGDVPHYKIKVIKNAGEVTFFCDCPGNVYHGKCWHINGDDKFTEPPYSGPYDVMESETLPLEPWVEWAEEAALTEKNNDK